VTSGSTACILKDFRGTGTTDGDKLMVQDAPACGMATGFIPGLPQNGVLTARTPAVPRDSLTPHAAGTWYRFEAHEVLDRYRAEYVTTSTGFTARLCWCPNAKSCNSNSPEEFRIQAGLITILRWASISDFNRCEIGKACLVIIRLAPWNMPTSVSDLIMAKTGDAPNTRLATQEQPDVCTGEPVQGIGLYGDAISGRMTTGFDTRPNARIKDEEVGMFDMGTVSKTLATGKYRLCWCQASIRPCADPSEFVVDIGLVQINRPYYVWPECTTLDIPFESWRGPPQGVGWASYDDCCCNHFEAGTVGCKNHETDAFRRCCQYPDAPLECR